jgi:hypothetical protein
MPRLWRGYLRTELIEASLEVHFEMESYTAIKHGGEDPLHDCPECSARAYITWGEENGCVCRTELGECLRCKTGLTPNNVSWDNSDLCSYCDHIMSKDD